ncbi:MAG TPA: hypothetical protein VG367_16625 [Mucilaginibacter sp.]|nr:hypothetical protein [Mucilaginibacter sp.]
MLGTPSLVRFLVDSSIFLVALTSRRVPWRARLSTQLLHWDFIACYRVISWLCWVPNLIVAQIIINRRARIPAYIVTKRQVKPQLQD